MINRPDWINYCYEKEPDIEMLKKALENEQWLITDRETKLEAIRLKYQAMTTVPTTIEKTMNKVQLFDVHCPLWVKPYTPNQISKILWAYKYVTKQGYTNFTQVLFETFHEKEHNYEPISLEDLVIKNLKERN